MAVAGRIDLEMKYIVTTSKTVEQTVKDLHEAVHRNGFGVLHIHNLQETMKKKGVEFANDCQILEICNPHQAKKVLEDDMDLNMALPCRISVYSDGGATKIGTIRPRDLLAVLSPLPGLREVAAEVEEKIIKMIDEAK